MGGETELKKGERWGGGQRKKEKEGKGVNRERVRRKRDGETSEVY